MYLPRPRKLKKADLKFSDLSTDLYAKFEEELNADEKAEIIKLQVKQIANTPNFCSSYFRIRGYFVPSFKPSKNLSTLSTDLYAKFEEELNADEKAEIIKLQATYAGLKMKAGVRIVLSSSFN